jgi:thiol-disulfide isomerase/thioredoxin
MGTQKAAGAAPNRYRPLSAREPQSRGAAKRRQATQPWWRQNAPVLGAAITVVLLIAIFVVIAHNASGGPTTGIGASPSAAVASALAPTDPSYFTKVGTGGVPNPFKHVNNGGDFLKGPDGKLPEMVYVGAEYCPYCAAERWSMIMALNRFGSFSGLKQSASSSTDQFPDTPTFTFVDARFTSKYLTFSSVETQDRNQQALQTMSAQQNQVFTKYNSQQYFGQNAGGIPFISVANQYITNGAGYSPSILENERWDTIAGKLSDPNSEVTKDIVGNANYITATICQTTNQTPDTVCKAAPIPDIEKKL